jgi:hypothetical protein
MSVGENTNRGEPMLTKIGRDKECLLVRTPTGAKRTPTGAKRTPTGANVVNVQRKKTIKI